MIVDFRNTGTVLLFQKLIDIYYFSSCCRLDQFHLTPNIDCEYYSVFTLPNLCTDSVTIYSANESISRLRKTSLLADWDLAKRHLNVCTVSSVNCGQCGKCVRTLTALDALGKLDEFSEVFDIGAYQKKRAMNIGYAWASKKEGFYDELYPVLKKNGKLGISAFPWFVMFKLAKPVERFMRKLSPEKRRSLVAFAKRHHIRVPF